MPPPATPFRILVVSHSCVIAVNQQIYVDLAAIPGVEVALILPSHWKSEYDGSEIKPEFLPETKFPVFPLPVGKPGNVALHYYKSFPTKKFADWKPDIVLASQEPYSLSGWQSLRLARKLGVPYVFQTNQNILKQYPPPFVWIEKQALRLAAVALAYSEEARQVMLQKGRTGPASVLPYATDTRLFQPRDTDSTIATRVMALRTSLGIAETDFVIGYIGRLVPEKGLDSLLQAVAQLAPALRSRTKVLFVGSGAAEQSLRYQGTTLNLNDNLIFAGAVPHSKVGDYMASLDVFALPSRTTPSWKEQFGRVIIESLACSVPVIGSDSGQIPHLIRETGGGLVFPEGDADALSACLTHLIEDSDERVSLGRVGRQAVVDGFTTQAVARRLYEVLRGCSPTPQPPPSSE